TLIRNKLEVLSVWRSDDTGILVENQIREWREDWAFLIPSDAASNATVRWLNADGTIQVYSGSLNQASPLIGSATMLIVMPTRVEVIRDNRDHAFDAVNRIFHGLDFGTTSGSLPWQLPGNQ